MTSNKSHRTALARLADAFVEDVLNASNEDMLAEAREDHLDPAFAAAQARGLFETAVTAARAVLAQRREPGSITPLSPAKVRHHMQRILTGDGEMVRSSTYPAEKDQSPSAPTSNILNLLDRMPKERQEMVNKYFDMIVIVPLEEEFETVSTYFEFISDLSNGKHIRFAVTLPGRQQAILLVKQAAMGKTACQEAASEVLDEFGCGVLVCLGIAGALSQDVKIGDVCYSLSICDVLDNAKIVDTPKGKQHITLSPTWYLTSREITVPLSLDRLLPEGRIAYIEWSENLRVQGRQLIPGEFTGRKGREVIERPRVREGVIACGLVSGSPAYNGKIQAIDRKILAIETESGGLFSVAQQHGVPALTIRGISDYAGIDKNAFEAETGNNARLYAIRTASSFLIKQFENKGILAYLDRRSLATASDEAQLPLAPPTPPTKKTAADILIQQADGFADRLRELAPGYSLVGKGYKLPVPRVRIADTRAGVIDMTRSQPLEVRDALQNTRVITLHVPREYPDLSLSWIIASDLLSSQIEGRQLVPTVVEARSLHRPRTGIKQLGNPEALALSSAPEFCNVFVVDDFNFGSKSRCDFLKEQIDEWPDSRFIIVTRNREDVYLQAEFSKNVASAVGRLCEVSFVEIATFIEKNFEIDATASEVIATRLRETFLKYGLPAHPSYFADIPSSTLNALLQANRRAELIEIAVTGYLSFVVSEDREPIALSRKTREKFLSELAFALNAEKRSFTEAELTYFAEEFAKKFDFSISPARFIAAFIDKHILHLEEEKVRFTLPFMEAFVLAKRLVENPDQATSYFKIDGDTFDYRTFAIYAELGSAPEIIAEIKKRLTAAIDIMSAQTTCDPILLDPTMSVAVLDHPDRLRAVQRSLQKAEDDVRNSRQLAKEKQKILDATDRLREDLAAKSSALQAERDQGRSRLPNVPDEVEAAWGVAVSLLGSGAERLEADIKRELIQKIVKLTAFIIDQWTRSNKNLNFGDIKKEVQKNDDLVMQIAKSTSKHDMGDGRRFLGDIVDLLEYFHMIQPFLGAASYLCEEAREAVLAESIANTSVAKGIEELIQGLWLSDINVPRGRTQLVASIRQLPRARLLRDVIAAHLMVRVFWKQWRKDDRLTLLNAADESLKGVGRRTTTGELKRIIESLPEKENGG